MLVMSLLLVWSYFERVLELQCDNFVVHCLSFSDVFAFIKHQNYNRIVFFFSFRDGTLCCVPVRVLSLCVRLVQRARTLPGPAFYLLVGLGGSNVGARECDAENKYVTSGLSAANFHSTVRLHRLVGGLFFLAVVVGLFLIF